MDAKRREKNTAMLEWFDALTFALIAVMLVLLFVVRTVRVDGISMEPTLMNGDQVFARSAFYNPKRGDIVVVDGYTNYGEPLVKRVIGVGGDVIDIDFETGAVWVNGQLLDEPYIADLTTRGFDVEFPLTVPEGQLFLMGDNRLKSKDSRSGEIGCVDERDILGKVVLRMLPINRFGPVQ